MDRLILSATRESVLEAPTADEASAFLKPGNGHPQGRIRLAAFVARTQVSAQNGGRSTSARS
jgi:hypothetical protein